MKGEKGEAGSGLGKNGGLLHPIKILEPRLYFPGKKWKEYSGITDFENYCICRATVFLL